MRDFENPDAPGNGSKFWTGKKCIEVSCNAVAGTAWSPHWCFKHNVERMRRINDRFELLFKPGNAR